MKPPYRSSLLQRVHRITIFWMILNKIYVHFSHIFIFYLMVRISDSISYNHLSGKYADTHVNKKLICNLYGI